MYETRLQIIRMTNKDLLLFEIDSSFHFYSVFHVSNRSSNKFFFAFALHLSINSLRLHNEEKNKQILLNNIYRTWENRAFDTKLIGMLIVQCSYILLWAVFLTSLPVFIETVRTSEYANKLLIDIFLLNSIPKKKEEEYYKTKKNSPFTSTANFNIIFSW